MPSPMADLPVGDRVRHARARRVRGCRPHRPGPARRAAALRPHRAGPPPHPGRRPRRAGGRARAGRPHPARSARRRPQPRRSRAARTGSPSSTSSCRSPAATPRARGRAARRPRPAAAPPPARRRPARRLPGAARAAWRRSRCAATSPAASTPCCACATATPSGTSSSTTRRTGSGPIGPDGPEPLLAGALHPGPARRGDDRRALPAAGAAVLRRAAPVPAMAAGVATTRSDTSAGVLYLFLRGMCGPDGPAVDGVPCGVFSWRPPARARDGAVGPARPGRVVTTARALVSTDTCSTTRTTHGSARAAPPGCWRRSTRRACSSPPTCTSPRGSRGSAARPRDDVRARAGAGRARGPARVGVRRPGRGAGHGARRGRRARRRLRPAVARTGRPGLQRAPRARSSPTGRTRPDGRPLRLVDGLLYLERYWRQEELVRTELAARADAAARRPVDLERLRAALDRLFGAVGDPREHRQRLAAAVAALRPVTVLAGGPGTGKTTTVAKILALLRDRPGAPPRIALAAPTGKAAARLQEAVREAGVDDLPTASTLHRLLGWQPGRSRFRHDRYDRLPYDVIVVDETSMVSLTMMARLLDAVRPDARLVLVGDPDQLASVEAGAVLGDLARASGRPEPHLDAALARAGPAGGVVNGVVTLRPRLALPRSGRRVRPGGADRRRGRGGGAAARRHGRPGVRRDRLRGRPGRGARRRRRRRARRSPPRRGATDVPAALAALERHRVLCGHRRGPLRRGAVEPRDRAVAGRGAARPDRARRVVPRPPGARHGQRLRHRPLQRRHRRRRRHRGRPAGGLPRTRRCRSRPPGWRTSRPCTP